jgi:hypothetical protein
MTEKEIVTDDDDFVMIERNGEILSGGFRVDSILLKHKQSPMHTLNQKFYGGASNVSDLFKDLAVPSGIFFQPNKTGGYKENRNKVIEEEEVEDDLYDKLVKLASVQEKIKEKKQRKTKRGDMKPEVNKKKITKKNHKVKISN